MSAVTHPTQSRASRSGLAGQSPAGPWTRRALFDAILAGGAGFLVISAMLVLIRGAGEQVHAGVPAVGSPDRTLVPLLAVAAFTTLLGGAWFIARRLRDLRALDRDNRRLSEALVEAADAERTRIGQNLHDDLGQHLTAIGMLSVSLRNRLSQASPALATDAARLAELAEEAGWRTRQLTRACLIDWTERAGLVRSLDMLCASASDLFDIDIETRIDDRFDATDPSVASHIARIVSEAINNAVRHTDPQSIIVSLQAIRPRMTRHAAPARAVRAELLIEDHRSDNSPRTTRTGSAEPGLGIQIMRARARAIGGQLEAIDRGAHGLTIRCNFTWKPARAAHQRDRPRKHTGVEQAQRPNHAARTDEPVIPIIMCETEQGAAIATPNEKPSLTTGTLATNQQPAKQVPEKQRQGAPA